MRNSRIKALSAGELHELRAWLAEYDAEVWDEFSADVAAGKLGAIADRALRDHSEHRSTEFVTKITLYSDEFCSPA